MNVIRYESAPFYDAPGHSGMSMRRLQGREAGPADQLWLGMSEIVPGGGTTLDASPIEKFYIVFAGAVTISNGAGEVVLHAGDSCRIAPGEARQLRNASGSPATILLCMPLKPSQP